MLKKGINSSQKEKEIKKIYCESKKELMGNCARRKVNNTASRLTVIRDEHNRATPTAKMEKIKHPHPR